MSFERCETVRFAHVDAAGIVFYPRYFEMLNGVVEDWGAAELGAGFREMHQDWRMGVPTVRLEAEFPSPSRLGDRLAFRLGVRQVGKTSCTVRVEARCDDELRLRGSIVLVCMDLDAHQSRTWPPRMKQLLTAAAPDPAEAQRG